MPNELYDGVDDASPESELAAVGEIVAGVDRITDIEQLQGIIKALAPAATAGIKAKANEPTDGDGDGEYFEEGDDGDDGDEEDEDEDGNPKVKKLPPAEPISKGYGDVAHDVSALFLAQGETLEIVSEVLQRLPDELAKSLSIAMAHAGGPGLMAKSIDAQVDTNAALEYKVEELSKSLSRIESALNIVASGIDGIAGTPEATPRAPANKPATITATLRKSLGANGIGDEDEASAPDYGPTQLGLTYDTIRKGLFLAAQDPELVDKYDLDPTSPLDALTKGIGNISEKVVRAAAEALEIPVVE